MIWADRIAIGVYLLILIILGFATAVGDGPGANIGNALFGAWKAALYVLLPLWLAWISTERDSADRESAMGFI
jgi:hypothetical protein